jgi:glycosyltransferase involved in cell wall biosynthesis
MLHAKADYPMRSRPLVSAITPTFERHSFLPLLYNCFKRQSFVDIEWLVMDDSALPSEFMQTLDDPRVHYEHRTERLSIGMKRNLLIERAQGDVIMHFDDDDFYGSEYVSNMISALNAANADIVKLYGAYHYSKLHNVFAYWDYTEVFNQHMTLDFNPPKWTDFLMSSKRRYGKSLIFQIRILQKTQGSFCLQWKSFPSTACRTINIRAFICFIT